MPVSGRWRWRRRDASGGGGGGGRVGAAVAAVVVAVVAAAVDGDRTSRSSTTSFFSVISRNGIGFYRFSYNGSDKAYVGVMAQDVQLIEPDAVTQGRDGYLRVFYDKVGVEFQTYEQWIASGAHVPAGVPVSH